AARHAERDSRVAPVHAPPEQGLAGARNAGMRAANGTYLLFLDGDDVLVPGALAALDARLADTGDVDVLHFEHERVPWWEGEPANPAAPLLADTPDGAFAPGRARGLTGVLLPAWSAAWRRAFAAEQCLAFPPGHFTDIGWGGLAMLGAERVAVLRAVVVRHLVRRQGSRPNLPGGHHAELLDQADLVLARAADLEVSADRAGPLFEQLFAAVLKTAAHPRRLPSGRR
ncbi:glycosyltransferase, partial [Streptomyces sp. SM1]